jgi:hypothetical protein
LRGFLRQAFNAAASFCARVFGLDFGATTGAVEGAGLPAPLNVALAGAPKIDGCGEGAALHDSPVSHGGGKETTGG